MKRLFRDLSITLLVVCELSKTSSVEETLHQAEGLEKEYDWCGVAKCYEKAIGLMPAEDFSRMSETQERLGYAFYRAAFQVEDNNEFMERMRQAVAAYENARKFYGRLNGSAKTPRMLRCDDRLRGLLACIRSA